MIRWLVEKSEPTVVLEQLHGLLLAKNYKAIEASQSRLVVEELPSPKRKDPSASLATRARVETRIIDETHFVVTLRVYWGSGHVRYAITLLVIALIATPVFACLSALSINYLFDSEQLAELGTFILGAVPLLFYAVHWALPSMEQFNLADSIERDFQKRQVAAQRITKALYSRLKFQ